MSEPVIEFQNVTKTYYSENLASGGFKGLLLHLPSRLKNFRNREALDALTDVSFSIDRGECVGIIGRNGAGKSTTLGLMAGILRPTHGKVIARGRIAPLLELGAGFHPELSGRDNIILNAVVLGLTRREALDRLDAIIEFSELESFIDRPVRTYSTGMEARLGFSVAAHLDPNILLVDETLSVGDAKFTEKCLKRIDEFRARGVTIVIVSHALETVEAVCSRVFYIQHGRLVASGAPDELIGHYKAEVS